MADIDRCVEVSRKSLINNKKICCPPMGAESWNMHPRVYLSVGKDGGVTCPYCGTRYVLTD